MRSLNFATRPTTTVLWAGALVLLVLAPAAGRGDIILGNLGAASGSDSSSESINSSDFFAGSFTMGSQAYSLSDAQILLTFSPPRSTTFEIESDSTGQSQPSGAILSTFNNPIFGSGLITYTFTPDSPFTFAPNTTYWLVGSTSNALGANWAVSNPPTNPTGSGADFGNYASSSDGGATWTKSISNAAQFQLDGTAVPEPSYLVMVGAFACVAGAVRLRRRRSPHS